MNNNVAFQNQANFGVKLLHICGLCCLALYEFVFLMLFCWGVFSDVKTVLLPFRIVGYGVQKALN